MFDDRKSSRHRQTFYPSSAVIPPQLPSSTIPMCLQYSIPGTGLLGPDEQLHHYSIVQRLLSPSSWRQGLYTVGIALNSTCLVLSGRCCRIPRGYMTWTGTFDIIAVLAAIFARCSRSELVYSCREERTFIIGFVLAGAFGERDAIEESPLGQRGVDQILNSFRLCTESRGLSGDCREISAA